MRACTIVPIHTFICSVPPVFSCRMAERGGNDGKMIRERTDLQLIGERKKDAFGASFIWYCRLCGAFSAAGTTWFVGGGADLVVCFDWRYGVVPGSITLFVVGRAAGTELVQLLCQVAVSGNIQPQWEELRRYGEVSNWTSLVKSAVVPGLGQMGKGHYAEGWLTLTGELLFCGWRCLHLLYGTAAASGDARCCHPISRLERSPE